MSSNDRRPPKKHPANPFPAVAPSTPEELWAYQTEELVAELHRRHLRAVFVFVSTPNPDDANHGGDFEVGYQCDRQRAIDDLRYAIRTLRSSAPPT